MTEEEKQARADKTSVNEMAAMVGVLFEKIFEMNSIVSRWDEIRKTSFREMRMTPSQVAGICAYADSLASELELNP